ncbi:MAG: DNA ligase D [Betaproteobacteria bacterium]|nr:DNA ligase D [Betaproteobacteria bacterium]
MASDALRQYKAKRNFSVTSEPAAGGNASAGALSFVIQKHWAGRLHYDFRLELDGTMKSWAVPKGPSLDTKDKRMAVQVEDHPIAYSSFEGTIPAGQYGAGKVIIWDSGTWRPVGDAARDYLAGQLKFELHGQKLHGKWVLVRMKGKGEKQPPWLLIKEKDEFVRPAAEFSVVDEMPDSVTTSSQPTRKPGRKAATAAGSKAAAKKTGIRRTQTGLPTGATKAPMPAFLAPQLATLADSPPSDSQAWAYEIKFDGYRLMTRIDGADIKLFTRNGNDWTSRLAPLQKAIAKAKLPAGWYDGEMVMLNEKDVPDFGALQQSFDAAKTKDIVLYLFDIPYFEGHDLRAVPLHERRALLQSLLEKSSSARVRFSEAFDAPAESVVASACKLGLEGVIAKRLDSAYVSRRSTTWIKLKCSQRQEFVIGGYTDPQGSRVGIGALLLGVHDENGVLRYAGKVGTGFDDRTLGTLKARLEKLTAAKSPFSAAAGIEGRAHWVKPQLVAEVSFGEWTRAGIIRHAVFHGLRADKPASAIIREKPADTKRIAKPDRAAAANQSHALNPALRVTNPERVIDPGTGITKIELVRYYGLVGDLMMAHLKGRPVSLVRAPSGVNGQLFFQKHAETEKLPGIRQLDPALYISHPPLLEIADKQGILSAAQWNVVEFHTLNTGTKALQHPDRMIFDLDPGEGVAWDKVRDAASLVHAFLQELGLPAFLKTSGGKGLHVVVPLRAAHDWDTVKGFSQAVVIHLAKTIPQRFVAKSGPKNRVGKIFIDYLRNGVGATTVCAWSARARAGLGISVPVAWEELASLKGGDHWTVRTAHARLDEGNSAWEGYARSACRLTAAMKMLNYPARVSA